MEPPGYFKGRHYTEWVDEVRRLKRASDFEGAAQLLLHLIDATEAEARAQNWPSPAPGYYEQLAIIYRKQERYEDEIRVLQRYMDFVGSGDVAGFADRLTKARRLAERRDAAASQQAACPYCAAKLERIPRSTRRCPACDERIIVETTQGQRILLTEAQRDANKRDRARDAAIAQAREVGATEAEFKRAEVELRGQFGVALPGDVFWRLANEKAAAYSSSDRWIDAGHAYQAMAKQLREEGKDPNPLQRQAVICYLRERAKHEDPDRALVVIGCKCPPCQVGPRSISLARALDTPPVPHEDCEAGWCKCQLVDDWNQEPAPYVADITVSLLQPGLNPPPERRGLLARLFGR